MQLQSSPAIKSVDAVVLITHENLLPQILDINLIFFITNTTHVGTTLRPVLFYCWRGYTILAPWHAMFLFSPYITNVWTNEGIVMWRPLCCCNVIIFLDILWYILINEANYLVTEKMQNHVKLSYDDDKTKHGHKAKMSQGLRKLMWLLG